MEYSSSDILLKYFSDFSGKQIDQFRALGELYSNWNAKINVISRKDIESLYLNHVLHSLSIAALFDFPPGKEILDIGTGGGFPGIPLAIFFPDVKFHLVDSINKKLKVVEEIKSALDLKNVTTQHIRTEDIRQRKFDFAVSRAVAPLKDLWEWCRHLLKSETYKTTDDTGNLVLLKSGLICLKGGDLQMEIAESRLHPKIVAVKSIFEEEYFREKFVLYVERGRP